MPDPSPVSITRTRAPRLGESAPATATDPDPDGQAARLIDFQTRVQRARAFVRLLSIAQADGRSPVPVGLVHEWGQPKVVPGSSATVARPFVTIVKPDQFVRKLAQSLDADEYDRANWKPLVGAVSRASKLYAALRAEGHLAALGLAQSAPTDQAAPVSTPNPDAPQGVVPPLPSDA